MHQKDSKIEIRLSKQEALVLFDFLARFNETGDLRIVDRSEKRILLDLLADLEKTLGEPLKPRYKILLEEARKIVGE